MCQLLNSYSLVDSIVTLIVIVMKFACLYNPLSPKNDQHQFSPTVTKFSTKSKGKVMRTIIDLLADSLNLFFK